MASPADRTWPAWWHRMDSRAWGMLRRSDALARPLTLHTPSVHTVCVQCVMGRFGCTRAYNI